MGSPEPSQSPPEPQRRHQGEERRGEQPVGPAPDAPARRAELTAPRLHAAERREREQPERKPVAAAATAQASAPSTRGEDGRLPQAGERVLEPAGVNTRAMPATTPASRPAARPAVQAASSTPAIAPARAATSQIVGAALPARAAGAVISTGSGFHDGYQTRVEAPVEELAPPVDPSAGVVLDRGGQRDGEQGQSAGTAATEPRSSIRSEGARVARVWARSSARASTRALRAVR
jgi:hypothetical protein